MSPKHIVIFRIDNIGDVILNLPLAAKLKQRFPQCKVTFISRIYTKAILDASPWVDGFIDWADLQQMGDQACLDFLQQQQFDVILHSTPNRQMAQWAKQAHIPWRVGTIRKSYNLLACNRWIYYPNHRHQPTHTVLHNLKLLKPLIRDWKMDEAALQQAVALTPAAVLPSEWEGQLDSKRKKIVLHPLSNGHGKEWPLQRYQELVRLLPADRYQLFVSGTEAERERLQPLLAEPNVTDVVAKLSLPEFVTFLSRADGLIVSGTGPAHMAAALGIHVLTLFPPRSGALDWEITAEKWKPIGKLSDALCVNHLCTCRVKGDTPDDCSCMAEITAEQVAERLSAWF